MAHRLQFVAETVCEAGRLTLDWFRTGVEVEEKADGSPVTVADRSAEALIRERLASAFPGEHIVGEEFGGSDAPRGQVCWYIDPIDGTKSFAWGVPLYGTLLACALDGVPFVGAVSMPALGETCAGAAGAGVWLTRGRVGAAPAERVRVSEQSDPRQSLLCTVGLDLYDEVGCGGSHHGLLELFGHTRGWCDCYGPLLVATGRAEAAIEPPRVKPWDVAPLSILIAEAGGTVTGWGGDASYLGPAFVGSNGRFHDRIVAAIGQGA